MPGPEMTRKDTLANIAGYIRGKTEKSEIINLVFICTHNSRRSHLAQIWAQTAAEYYSIDNVICWSGGTETTAFNENAVHAVKKAGFEVNMSDTMENPLYLAKYSEEKKAIKCFSKLFSDNFNPSENFAAVMTCSHADENCPYIPGAERRFSLPYEDPKIYDGTNRESEKYEERSIEIAAEMFYLFAQVKDK